MANKEPKTMTRNGEILTSCLVALTVEHGAPNRFSVAEVAQACGARPLTIGMIWKANRREIIEELAVKGFGIEKVYAQQRVHFKVTALPKTEVCTICNGKGYGSMGKMDGVDMLMACACMVDKTVSIPIPSEGAYVVTPHGVFGGPTPK